MKLLESIKDALKELSEKSLDDIQVATAEKWLGRAVAAYKLSKHDLTNRDKWLHDAAEYEHECLEHASLAKDEDLIHRIRKVLKSIKSDLGLKDL